MLHRCDSVRRVATYASMVSLAIDSDIALVCFIRFADLVPVEFLYDAFRLLRNSTLKMLRNP